MIAEAFADTAVSRGKASIAALAAFGGIAAKRRAGRAFAAVACGQADEGVFAPRSALFVDGAVGCKGAAWISRKANAFSAFNQAKVSVGAVVSAVAGLAADAEFFFGAPSDASASAKEVAFAREVVIAGATEFFGDKTTVSATLVGRVLGGAIGIAQAADQKSEASSGLVLV